MMPITVYDRVRRGLLEMRGADRQTFLHGMVSNDVLTLTAGQSCHAALLDSTGHLLADVRIYAFSEYLLVETDPDCFSDLFNTLNKFLIMEDVQMADVTAQWATLSVLGQGASEFVCSLLTLPGEVRPLAYCLVTGIDLWLPTETRDDAWEMLTTAGAVPMDEHGWEILRVEAGLPVWGRELTRAILLPETGMDDAVSYAKGCYVGQEIVARLHARGHANRALRRFLLADDAPVPPQGTTVHVPEDGLEPGREIGWITSAVASPLLGGRAIALGYIRKGYWDDGTPVSVQMAQPGGLMFSYGAIVQNTPTCSENSFSD